MRDYELVYVVRATTGDAEVGALIERVQGWIGAEGGEVQKVNPWGRRRLAYPIEDLRDGVYIQVNFRADPRSIKPLERNLKLTEDVVRYLLTRPGA
ncbi:MAG TPA: 30S ribosomal protein S6 [Chloroflexota bacterium]|jgi:small subunit ribosomal protein S6|nr:30S ribosomal protein S6 [Chloroflexota bacterium]